jgi:hypothetical protein
MSPWVHAHNLPGLTPLWKWSNTHGRMRKGVIRCKSWGKLFCCNGQSVINRVGTSMRTDCTSPTNRRRLTRYDNCSVKSAPLGCVYLVPERVGRDFPSLEGKGLTLAHVNLQWIRTNIGLARICSKNDSIPPIAPCLLETSLFPSR